MSTRITTSTGEYILFACCESKFYWEVWNRHEEMIARSRGFVSQQAAKDNLKNVVAIVSLAAINNFQP